MDRIVEVIAVLLSASYTFLYLISYMPEAYIPAIIGSFIFAYLCVKRKIYAESFLHLFYVLTAILGILFFFYGYPVGMWKPEYNFIMIAVSVLVTWLVGRFLKKKTQSKLPYVDAFTTVFSLGATWLMILNIEDNWYYWVVINSVTVVLYYMRGLKFGAILYFIYLLMAIDGCVDSITWCEDLAARFT